MNEATKNLEDFVDRTQNEIWSEYYKCLNNKKFKCDYPIGRQAWYYDYLKERIRNRINKKHRYELFLITQELMSEEFSDYVNKYFVDIKDF